MPALSMLFGTFLLFAQGLMADTVVVDWSQYERGKSVALAGVVQRIMLADGVLVLAVSPEAITGPPRSLWRVVLDTPTASAASGLPEHSFGPGALVQITGLAHRVRPRDVRAQRVTMQSKSVVLRTGKGR